MNISLQNETKVSARLNVVIEPIDYEEKLEKELKNYRKKASRTTSTRRIILIKVRIVLIKPLLFILLQT